MISKFGDPFTSERDGLIWLQGLEYSKNHDQEYYNRWKTNLAQAEITGHYTYLAVIKALKENSFNRSPDTFIQHAKIISFQELAHYKIVKAHLKIETEPVDHEGTFSELDINERRSEMRLTTILGYSKDPVLVELASRLIIDEAYHCWYTQWVLKELGDFPLPRLH